MKILHMFHDLMNLYGDYANVLALERALVQKGETVEIIRQSVDDKLDFDADFIYIGSGTERNQKVALEYLTPYAEELKSALGHTIMLTTGNSFEMFGTKITDRDDKEYTGLGIFNFTVKEGTERIVTDSIVKFEGKELIGFVNKASQIYGDVKHFFTVKQGAGNSDNSPNVEGVHDGNFYGTHIIGPLLIRNPIIAEYFASLLAK
ncbi:MAG: glutamine amidotransferase [Oscillospiraceae bacterium]|nr:glutamine amidotransferase [Oscillospiraceae bacterium]